MPKPKIEEKIYCIYQREWEILMAMAGIENCFGLVFQEEQQEKDDVMYITATEKNETKVEGQQKKEDMIHTLHRMVRKGMLRIDNERLKIAPDYKVWLENVKQAKRAFHFMQRQEEGWEQGFAYMGETVVVFSCSKTRKQAFDVRGIEKEKWINFLLDTGLFPSYRTECDCKVAEDMSMPHTKSHQLIFVKNITTIVAEIDMEKKQEIGWVAFCEENGLQFLLRQMETTKKIPYTMENLKCAFQN